jgi:adenylate kinase
MGIVDDELKHLKDVVTGLESRIKRLEQRSTGTAPSTEEIRMILIGPPGAGTQMQPRVRLIAENTC